MGLRGTEFDGCSTTELTSLKGVTFTPIPKANARMPMIVLMGYDSYQLSAFRGLFGVLAKEGVSAIETTASEFAMGQGRIRAQTQAIG
jgi:hypothetical protein